MDYNYHTHTYRCSHATGTPLEYVERAIENGIKYMGFSEHFPFKFPNGKQTEYRLKVEEVADYFDEIGELKRKYSDKIDIKIGFEMEYYEEFFDEMVENARKYKADYLILGQHFIDAECWGNIRYPSFATQKVEDLKDYVDRVVNAIRKKVFTYVAHPDMINFVGDEKVFFEEYRRICVASREYNTPLEINFLGIRDNRIYPNEKLFKVVGEEKSPVTFGFDAHDVMASYDGESEIKAKELVKKYNLNYIGRPEIVKI